MENILGPFPRAVKTSLPVCKACGTNMTATAHMRTLYKIMTCDDNQKLEL
jgi:hypothetical protein